LENSPAHFGEIYGIFLNSMKKTKTCKPVKLGNTKIFAGYVQISPRTLSGEDRQLVTDEPVEFEK
jgi:hypothetical protein